MSDPVTTVATAAVAGATTLTNWPDLALAVGRLQAFKSSKDKFSALPAGLTTVISIKLPDGSTQDETFDNDVVSAVVNAQYNRISAAVVAAGVDPSTV